VGREWLFVNASTAKGIKSGSQVETEAAGAGHAEVVEALAVAVGIAGLGVNVLHVFPEHRQVTPTTDRLSVRNGIFFSRPGGKL
jgi:hypothetical protein